MNKKLIATLVMSSLVASAFVMTSGANALTDHKVLKDEAGNVHDIVGPIGNVVGATDEEIALNALDLVKDNFGFAQASSNFKAKESHVDENGVTHTKLDRTINGIPVYGDEMIVHQKSGSVRGVTGHYSKNDVEPTTLAKADLNEGAAPIIEAAETYTGYKGELSQTPNVKKVYYPKGKALKLGYQVNLSYAGDAPGKWTIFVDANDYSILDAWNEIETIKPGKGTVTGTPAVGSGVGVKGDKKSINTTLSNGTYYLIDQSKYMFQTNGGTVTTKNFANGTRTMTDMTDSDNVWDSNTQRAGVDAHYYAGKVYDYYYSQLGRNSYDNAGHTLLSGVHYGNAYNNAFWDGTQMTYGDGDGITFINFAGGFDVVAHELTHAVTEHTSNLTYRDQSGALNESWSDAMASVIEGANWLIGEDIYTPNTPGDALRSMSNPAQYGDPDNMASYVNTTSDNGGVHTNSGIPNKAFYNFATSINSRTIAGKVWYTASRDYMTSTTNFSGARAATLQAAAALYGAGSSTYIALQNAWSAVGVN